MLMPLLAVFAAVVGFPLCYAVYLSVTDFKLTDSSSTMLVSSSTTRMRASGMFSCTGMAMILSFAL